MNKPKFIIGVWAAPVSMFTTWKARGINTLVGYDSGGVGSMTQAQWEAEALKMGLWIITLPEPDRIAEQAAQPHRLGFQQRDEPDLRRGANDPGNISAGPYRGWTKPDILAKLYADCKAAAPNLPVLVNFSGPAVTPADYKHGDGHDPYIKSADWLCHDWHIYNADATRYTIQQPKDAIRRLAGWSANPSSIITNGTTDITDAAKTGKPQLCYVEAGDQGLNNANGRGPTPDEYEAEVRNAVAAGCIGIINFATAFNVGWPQGYDATIRTPGLVERMTALNAELDPPLPADPVTNADLQQQLNRIEAKLDKLVETVVPIYNGVVFGRDKANADPILKPFTWLPSEHWRNEKKADWWVAAKDYWGAVNKPADPNHDPLYSQRLRLAGRIAAQAGAPVNLDHELAGGNYTAEQIGWIAEHVRIFKGGAGVPIQVGVYDVWAQGRPVQTNQEAANPTPATEQRVKAAIEAAKPLWDVVDYILIDAYLWETDAAGEALTIRCHSNMVRWIKAHSGKPVWVYVAGRLKTGNNTYGGIVSADLAKRHVKALVEAGADALVLFGAYDDAAGYLAAVKK